MGECEIRNEELEVGWGISPWIIYDFQGWLDGHIKYL